MSFIDASGTPAAIISCRLTPMPQSTTKGVWFAATRYAGCAGANLWPAFYLKQDDSGADVHRCVGTCDVERAATIDHESLPSNFRHDDTLSERAAHRRE